MIGKLLILLVVATPAMAETRVSLIGGGNTVDHSQVQIEANVGWLQTMFRERDIEARTYFGAGDTAEPDVAYLALPEPSSSTTEALSNESRVQFRRHQLPDVSGSTRRPELMEALRRDLASLPPGDDALVIFNGHGGLDRADTRNNYLKLWGDGRMTVSDLETLLDAAPQGAPVRFVMAQCYSGAFASLIYDDPQAASGFRSNRCGFMSEAADRLAEGCGLSLEEAEFRDYTTYFFAALGGRMRSGEPIEQRLVDRDRDGVVSFRESHFYALVSAPSSDLSRSTSEQYLEDWSPWYLRWDSLGENGSSIYWSLAEELARRYGWTSRPAALSELRGRYASAVDAADERRVLAQKELHTLREQPAEELAS
ncbi:MAG TPA: hypothetical protein VNA66_03445, partial [Gammaproteobacteria bacterium]|nr:hypothetical protein [Gammaproteobacteria bacterium]